MKHAATSLRFLAPVFCLVMGWRGMVPARALMLVSEKEEIRIGKQVAANAEKAYGGVLHDRKRQARLDRVAHRILRFRTRKNIPYRFRILNNDKEVNAFACPGGPVYITKKLFDMCDTDGKLAFIMAHEVSHTELQHGRKAINKALLANAGFSILFGKSSESVKLGVGIAWNIIDSGYSRDQERAADANGLRLMVKAGYDPYEAIHALEMLGDGKVKGLQKYFASHPPTPERIELLQKEIAAEFPDKVRPGEEKPIPQKPSPPVPPSPPAPTRPAPQKPPAPASPPAAPKKPDPSSTAGKQGYIIATDPGGAEVWIDGSRAGFTPDSPLGRMSVSKFFPVSSGTHSVVLRKPGVGEWRARGRDQVIRKNRVVRFTVTLGRRIRVTLRVDEAPRPVFSINLAGHRVCRGAGPGTITLPRGTRTKFPVTVRMSFSQASGWLSLPEEEQVSFVLKVRGSSLRIERE